MSTTAKPSNSNGVHKSKPISQRIRDTKRLLAKTDLAETIRNGQERILAALVLEQEEKKTGGKEKKHQSYYRKIKFIERVKLMRRLEAAEKKLSTKEDGPDRQAIKELVIDAQRKLKYIEQFPRTENYISIIKEDAEMDEGSRTKRAHILEGITVDSLTSNPIKQFTLKKKIKKAKITTDETPAEENVIASDDFFSTATKEAVSDSDSPTKAKKSKKDKKEKKSKKEEKKSKKEKKESRKSKQHDATVAQTNDADTTTPPSDNKADKKKSKKSKKEKKDPERVVTDVGVHETTATTTTMTTPTKISKRKSMLGCDTPRPSTKKIKRKKIAE